MKKKILGICIVVLMLVVLVSGCTENKSNNSGDTDTTPQTYTWTAKEIQDDMSMDTDWTTYFTMVYNTLADGDTLIIQDTITEVSYDSDKDQTTISFELTDGSYYSPVFEGNLTTTYQADDQVKITVTIKHVEFTHTDETLGTTVDYEIEIFEEQWTTQEEYLTSQGGAIPATSIEKVE